MDKNHAIVEQDGHILIITLNRPEKRNALSPGMLITVYEAWRRLDEDDELRCAILTGAGGTFCSGADLSAMKDGNEDSEMMQKLKEIPDLHWQSLLRHNRPLKPIIAAVEGFALAGGTEILQGTDIRVAGKSSAVLLANHGPVVAGKNLETAANAIEELENTAKLALILSGAKPLLLSNTNITDVINKFKIKWD